MTKAQTQPDTPTDTPDTQPQPDTHQTPQPGQPYTLPNGTTGTITHTYANGHTITTPDGTLHRI